MCEFCLAMLKICLTTRSGGYLRLPQPNVGKAIDVYPRDVTSRKQDLMSASNCINQKEVEYTNACKDIVNRASLI